MPNEPTPSPQEAFSCEDTLDLLHALLHNELEDDDAELCLRHLATCKSCREALSQHVKLSGLLKSEMPWLGKLYFNKVYSPHN